ncbi:metallophosphoesterase [Bacteroides sp.]|uniref:metallophosphoesterase n=1 Tax=Bacteroides sp. TaxID=29523 RepID=UPI00261475CA|nr:metallophosphoesterase [Bacteroides sp.]MDD3038400.1 metallophosphoesterase [Bacteroides sp.]
MKKKFYPFLLLVLFALTACKSKKNVLASSAVATLATDTIQSLQKDTYIPPKHSEINDLTEQMEQNGKVKVEIFSDEAAPGVKIYSSSLNLGTDYSGIERVMYYDFTHNDIPEAFDGFRIAFISDLHYKSLFGQTSLRNLVRLLNKQKADVLLMGGDYQEGCEHVEPLFAALSEVKTSMGIYGVMGNNDYERCHDEIIRTMEHYGMHVLEHKVDTLCKDGQQILIAGVRNPFDLTKNGVSPTLALSPKDFVVLLVHTPDYVEDVSIANTDLALAGHTHGGQVRIFGKAPIQNSHYGMRFLTGFTYNSNKAPLIVTNGIGTSQLPIRIGAPAEIIMITLHSAKKE